MRTKAIPIAEEKHGFGHSRRLGRGFDPLAHSHIAPHGFEETDRPASGLSAVVDTHDGLYGLGRPVRVIERNRRDVVVQNMSFDDAM